MFLSSVCRRLAIVAIILWASPWTLFGLFWGGISLLTGGKVQRVGRVFEFSGGCATKLLRRFPILGGASAITLGHTVLAVDRDVLETSRSHERIHVGQYERWGPFFVPAYLGASIYLWCRGRNPYFDNPFEREAYRSNE